jgi:hypothetical protein
MKQSLQMMLYYSLPRGTVVSMALWKEINEYHQKMRLVHTLSKVLNKKAPYFLREQPMFKVRPLLR